MNATVTFYTQGEKRLRRLARKIVPVTGLEQALAWAYSVVRNSSDASLVDSVATLKIELERETPTFDLGGDDD